MIITRILINRTREINSSISGVNDVNEFILDDGGASKMEFFHLSRHRARLFCSLRPSGRFRKWLPSAIFVFVTNFISRYRWVITYKVLIRDEFEWDNNELGKVMGSFSYGYMMSQIIGGFLADKFGGAIVMTYCGVVWSILTYLTPSLIRFR